MALHSPEPGVIYNKVWMFLQKTSNHRFIFLGFETADSINEQAAGFEVDTGIVQQSGLTAVVVLNGRRIMAPFAIGISLEHPHSGARRVQEDAIEFFGERDFIGLEKVRRTCVHDADSKSFCLQKEPRQLTLTEIRCKDAAAILHELGQMGRLGAETGAGIPNHLSGLWGDEVPDTLRRLILDLEPPFLKSGPLGEGTAGRREADALRAVQ